MPLSNVVILLCLDPLVDDSVDFAHRLHQNNIKVRLQVYDFLPHSFLDFSLLLPEVRDAIDQMGQWMKSHCTFTAQQPSFSRTNSNKRKPKIIESHP